MLLSVGLALLMTWVYLQTNRSILSGMMLHFTSNFTGQLIAPFSERFEIFRVLLIVSTSLVIFALFVRQRQAVKSVEQLEAVSK